MHLYHQLYQAMWVKYSFVFLIGAFNVRIRKEKHYPDVKKIYVRSGALVKFNFIKIEFKIKFKILILFIFLFKFNEKINN